MGGGTHLGSCVRPADRQVRGARSTLKVLDLTEFYSPAGGGVRTYLHEKIRWLADRSEFDHVVVTPGPRDDTRRIERTVIHQVGGPAAPGSPGYHVLWNGRALDRILRRERPDIVELGSPYLAPWLLAWARRDVDTRVVGFLHMDLVGAVRRSVPRGTRGLLAHTSGWYARRAYGRCHRLVAASDTMRTAAVAAGLPAPSVVPLGVDLDLFHPMRRSAEWRRAQIGDARRPIGLYVGRLAGEKDLDVLLAAVPELHRRTALKLVLIGEGRLRTRIEAMQRAAPDALEVLGFESDRARLAAAYASADVFIAPCTHETFGLAVLEAAASGLPAVGSSEGGVGEMLGQATWGATFAPEDSAGLVDAVEHLLARDMDVARANARAFADAYSWNDTFTELSAVYRDVTK